MPDLFDAITGAAAQRVTLLAALSDVLEPDPSGWTEIQAIFKAYLAWCDVWLTSSDRPPLDVKPAAALILEACKSEGLDVRATGSEILIKGVALKKKAGALSAPAS